MQTEERIVVGGPTCDVKVGHEGGNDHSGHPEGQLDGRVCHFHVLVLQDAARHHLGLGWVARSGGRTGGTTFQSVATVGSRIWLISSVLFVTWDRASKSEVSTVKKV